MAKKIGNFLKFTGFIVIFALIFNWAGLLLMRHDEETDQIHAFYGQAKDTVDVLYIGSSPLYRGMSPMTVYEKTGITGYMRASTQQAPAVSYALLQESLEYQSPKLVVLLLDNMFTDYEFELHESATRKALDGMKLSGLKMDLVKYICSRDERQSEISYVFPILRFHERWKDLDPEVDKAVEHAAYSVTKGQEYLTIFEAKYRAHDYMADKGEELPAYSEDTKYYTCKIIELCRSQGIEVMILHLPKVTWTYAQSLAMENLAVELDVDYLDLDKDIYAGGLDINPDEDFYDQGHLNLRGSLKASSYIADYIAANYNLPDRRGTAGYESWDADLKEFQSGVASAQVRARTPEDD